MRGSWGRRGRGASSGPGQLFIGNAYRRHLEPNMTKTRKRKGRCQVDDDDDGDDGDVISSWL